MKCPKLSLQNYLYQDKSDGPGSILTKILKLLDTGVSDQMAILFDQSFYYKYFFQFWKTVKLFRYTNKVLN